MHHDYRTPSFLEPLEDRRLLSWGTFPHLIGQDAAAANFPKVTGAGTSIVILDNGIDFNHPDLGGGIGAGHKVVYAWDYVTNSANPTDHSGHGTGVASVAAGLPFTYGGQQFSGIAPGANLISLRTDDGTDDFNHDGSRIHQALQWVLANRAKYNIVAINISTGSGFYTSAVSQSPWAADFAALASAGVLVAACSGNDGTTNPGTIEYPAADPNVYAVGATNSSDKVSSFSSRNSITDLMAPGENVTLAYYNPSTGQHVYLNYGNGTSFSSPALAGMAALLKQVNPSLTVAQEMAVIQQTAGLVYDPATRLTYPRLNVNDALVRVVEAMGARGALSGTAVPIGSTIQAENYDKGGQGIAYNDRTPANQGGKYRASAVDIETTADTGGGYDVAYVQPGEWLNYTISVAAAGKYDLAMRVAYGGALASGGTFHVQSDGTSITGTITMPKTGGWQTWQTITVKGVALSAGTHVLKLVFDKDGGGGTSGYMANINWLRLGAASTGTIAMSSADIGNTAIAGSDAVSSGVYTIAASGDDIWNSADAFRYVYQTLSGDGTIVARVTGIKETNPWAKAGVMIRSTLAANSANSYLALGAGGQAVFQSRNSTGGATSGINLGAAAPAYWLKLTRVGNTLSAYAAPEGSKWKLVGTQTVALGTNVYIGLAVTGHNNRMVTVATMDNVRIS